MWFFSIVTPTFNRAKMLKKAVKSVIGQTFDDWELIIVDDGSTDNTKELVKELFTKDHRIKYFFQENQGRSAARNKGIELAKGQYLCFLDSDDYFFSDYLQKLFDFIHEMKLPIGLMFSNIIYEDGQSKKTINYQKPAGNPLEYLFKNTIGTIQGCLHKNILRDFRFDEELVIGEDLALWMKVGDLYPIFYLETNSVVATMHEKRSVNKKNNPGLEELNTIRKIIRENKKQKNNLSTKLKRWKLSNCFASIGFSYYLSAQNSKAIKYLACSLLKDPNHSQTKFRLHAILTLLPFINWFFKKEKILSSINST